MSTMLRTTLKEFADEIKMTLEDCAFQQEPYPHFLALGAAGVGKTESIKGVAEDLGWPFISIRLVNYAVEDIKGGFDYTSDKVGERHATVATSDWLPREERDGEHGLLILDEVTSCTKDVQTACLQLLDKDRSLPNYHFPDGWSIIALGNGEGDGGLCNGLTAAFYNRFNKVYNVYADFPSWKPWAIKHGVHPAVISFLNANQSYFYFCEDPDDVEGNFPTPRSWTILARGMEARETRLGRVISEETGLTRMVLGGIGDNEAASRFVTYYKYNSKAIPIEKILDGTDDTDLSSLDTETMQISCGQVVNAVVKMLKGDAANKDKIKQTTNACNWLFKAGNVRKEYRSMAIQDLFNNSEKFMEVVNTDEFLDGCPEFLEILNDPSIKAIYNAK